MVAPVQLHTKDAITAAALATSDKVVVIDVSASNAVKLITVAELDTYLSS